MKVPQCYLNMQFWPKRNDEELQRLLACISGQGMLPFANSACKCLGSLAHNI